MKKNKLYAIAVIAAVCCVAVLTVSCELFGTVNGVVKGIPTNFKFRNAAPPANVGKSVSRAMMGGATIDAASFAELTAYYTTKEPSFVKAYTPTSFTFYKKLLQASVEGFGTADLDGDLELAELVDFVKGTTIQPEVNIPPGIKATGMLVMYQYRAFQFVGGPANPPPTTTFTIDAPLTAGHPWINLVVSIPGFSITYPNNGTTITVPTEQLYPNEAFGSAPEFQFVFTGNEYRYEPQFTGDFSHHGGTGGFIVPWAGAATSGNSEITFNVNWDLNGLIVQYGTGTAARFVFANKFWERFSFTVD